MLAVMRVTSFVAVVTLRKFLHVQCFFWGWVRVLGVETVIMGCPMAKCSHEISSWSVQKFLNCNIKWDVFLLYALLLLAGDKSNRAIRQNYSVHTGLMGGYLFCFVCQYAMAFHLQISPIKNYDLYIFHIQNT